MLTEANKNIVSFVIALILGIGGGCILGAGYNPPPKIVTNTVQTGITKKQITFSETMRKLWADNVIWTRQYMTSLVSGGDDAKEISNRLIQNQISIGNTIADYFGGNAGSELTALLKEHILIGSDLINAVKSGSQTRMTENEARWNSSAEKIARFMNNLNPGWGKDKFQSMLSENISFTKEEILSRINKRWSDNISLFDRKLNHNMAIADIISSGIIKKFPNKF